MERFVVYIFLKGIGIAEDLGHKLLQLQYPTSYTNPEAYKDGMLNQIRREYGTLVLAEFAFVLPSEQLEYNDLLADVSGLMQGWDELDDALEEYKKFSCPECHESLYEVGINVIYECELEFVPEDGDSNNLSYKTPDSVGSIKEVSCAGCHHDLDVDACSEMFGLR